MSIVSNPFGQKKHETLTKKTGIIIGAVTMRLLSRDDVLFLVASFENYTAVCGDCVEMFEERLGRGEKDGLLGS